MALARTLLGSGGRSSPGALSVLPGGGAFARGLPWPRAPPSRQSRPRRCGCRTRRTLVLPGASALLPCVGPQLGGHPLQKELTLSDGVPAQGPQVGARHRDHGVGHALVSRPAKCAEEERREAAEEWRGGVKRGHFLREKGRRSWEEKPRRRDNRDGAATTRLGGTEKEEGKRVAIVLYIPLENCTSGAGLEFFLPSFSLYSPLPPPLLCKHQHTWSRFVDLCLFHRNDCSYCSCSLHLGESKSQPRVS